MNCGGSEKACRILTHRKLPLEKGSIGLCKSALRSKKDSTGSQFDTLRR